MYESMTYEIILQRMINRVLEKDPNQDTREGSIIWYALAPAAVELQNMYIELDTILKETFADTAGRYYLIKRCAERYIYPKPASKAVWRGEFNIDVPIGSRYSLELMNYTVTEKISSGVYMLECEIAGSAGNGYSGVLIPIEYIAGLTSAVLTELLIPGEDEEDTERLRQRYLDSFKGEAFGGNVADYKSKVNSVSGVGGVKVYRAWNGGGTVKLIIISSQFTKPSDMLTETVQTIIDPVPNQGSGLGLAPIGHIVTVLGVESETVDIDMNIIYEDGWEWSDIKQSVEDIVDGYFLELSKEWQNSKALVVRISQIESRILDVTGVLDIIGTTLNGHNQNLTLETDCIPKRGALNG